MGTHGHTCTDAQDAQMQFLSKERAEPEAPPPLYWSRRALGVGFWGKLGEAPLLKRESKLFRVKQDKMREKTRGARLETAGGPATPKAMPQLIHFPTKEINPHPGIFLTLDIYS